MNKELLELGSTFVKISRPGNSITYVTLMQEGYTDNGAFVPAQVITLSLSIDDLRLFISKLGATNATPQTPRPSL